MFTNHDKLDRIEKKIGNLNTRENARFSITSDSVANTEVVLNHNLGRVPAGYIVISQSGAGSLYVGSTDWTRSKAYFKSEAVDIDFTVLFI